LAFSLPNKNAQYSETTVIVSSRRFSGQALRFGESMTTPSQTILGLGIVTFSGVLTASFPVPMKFSHTWNWENTWLVYATLAFVIIPVSLAARAVPHLLSVYASVSDRDLLLPALFGFGWGLAQVTFGLSIARVGMAMAFAIVIGLSALLGSMIPLVVFHPGALTGRQGAMLLASAVLLVWGLVLYARAGREREKHSGGDSPSRISFTNGLVLCVFTGCFGAMINLGFVFGGNIATAAEHRGVSAEFATLSVWAVVLVAGYVPNAAYTLFLLNRNHSAQAFPRSFLREILLASLASAFWLFGMLGYGMGAARMGTWGNSIGFGVCMAVLLLWSTALGVFAGEWRLAPKRARSRMHLGVACIAASTLILSFESLLH
jgi:L-rhamnose-H+ transport protein